MVMQSKLWRRLVRVADEEVRRSLVGLSLKLRLEGEKIPCLYEPHPGPDLVAEGVERDILGLFVGEAYPDLGCDMLPLPAQIILYLENIWDYAGHNLREYRKEVGNTYLHEFGHYLGLSEEDLFERGLD